MHGRLVLHGAGVCVGDVVAGGLIAGLGRGLGSRLASADAGDGEEAGVADALLAVAVVEPVADVGVDLVA